MGVQVITASGAVKGAASLLGYTEFTAGVSITAITAATANTVVTGPAITFDGLTLVRIEFYSPYIYPPASAAVNLVVVLYDGANRIDQLGIFGSQAANQAAVGSTLARYLTPSVGSHTYSIRSFVGSGSGTIGAGLGGADAYAPGYIRIARGS